MSSISDLVLNGNNSNLLSGVSIGQIANPNPNPQVPSLMNLPGGTSLQSTGNTSAPASPTLASLLAGYGSPIQNDPYLGGVLTGTAPSSQNNQQQSLGTLGSLGDMSSQSAPSTQSSFNPTSASATMAAIGDINNAHQTYAASGGTTLNNGSSGMQNSPFSQIQQATQDAWGAANGLSPYQAAQAGNQYTPEEYNQIAQTQANGAQNQLTNMERNFAWGATGIGGSSGSGFTSTAGSGQYVTTSDGSYDISAHATDPTYTNQVNSIYGQISSQVSTPQQLSQYIQSVNPNSPISGNDIYSAAQASGVNPILLASQIQQESKFGNSDVATQDNNLTGINYNPSDPIQVALGATQGSPKPASEGGGFYAKFPTPQAAVQWEANNLKNEKVDPAQIAAQQQQQQQNFQQYGLLANAPDFNPNTFSGMAVSNYLQDYISNQKTPTPSSLGLTPAQKSQFTNIQNTAGNVFFQATGYKLPSVKDLQAYQTTYDSNVSTINNLNASVASMTQNANFNIQNLTNDDFNGSNQIVNSVVDAYKNIAGDPNMAAALAQNTTIGQEMAKVLGVSNTGGVTVADKLAGGDIFNNKQSVAQKQQILSVLSQEASNVESSYVNANAKVFKIIDPFLQDPNNPLRQQYADQLSGGSSSGGQASSGSGGFTSQTQSPDTFTGPGGTYTLGSDGTYYLSQS